MITNCVYREKREWLARLHRGQLAVGTWTAISRISIGRCWMGAVSEPSRVNGLDL